MIAINKNIQFIEIKNLIPNGFQDTEAVAIELIKENTIIVSIYHPHENPNPTIYEKLMQLNTNLIVQGDLNAKHLD